MRRSARAALAAVALISMASLAACGPAQPALDDAALSEWATQIIDDGDAGGMGGKMSTDGGGEGVRQDFRSGAEFTSVELRCKGADRAAFTLRYTSIDGAVTVLTQNIVCADGAYRTPIAVPTGVGALSAFAVDASSPDGRGYWVAVPRR